MRDLAERFTVRSTDGDIQRRVVRTAATMDAAFPDAADLRLRPRISPHWIGGIRGGARATRRCSVNVRRRRWNSNDKRQGPSAECPGKGAGLQVARGAPVYRPNRRAMDLKGNRD